MKIASFSALNIDIQTPRKINKTFFFTEVIFGEIASRSSEGLFSERFEYFSRNCSEIF
jgi:hypothetical protein